MMLLLNEGLGNIEDFWKKDLGNFRFVELV